MKFTESELKKMVDLYNEVRSTNIVAKHFNSCSTTISKYLKLQGINVTCAGRKSDKRFSLEKEQEIIRLYKSGKTQKEIATIFNTFNTSIRRVLLRNNIIPRSGSKVSRLCKHNPFKKHDEYSEYFLGLLLTDGCISKDKNANREYSINLSLTETDGYIVEKFRNWASPKAKVGKSLQKLNNSYMYSVSITNREAVEWLRRKGNFYNKSFECKIYCPITWHILRGIFDGDGGFHLTNKEGLNFFICGLSKVFIYQIYNFLIKHDIKAKVRFSGPDKWHKNGLYYVEVHNYADVIKIGKYMYSNAHIFINRKYERWLTFYENKRDKYDLNSGKEKAIQP